MRTLVKVLLWVFGILAVVCAILYFALFDVWTIPLDDPQLAASIEPQLSAGDTVLVWRSTNPDTGTLVRCPDPDQPGRYVVARIVGKGGDVVDVHDGTFSLNNHGVSAPVACDPPIVTVRHPVTHEERNLNCAYEEFAGLTHPALRQGTDNKRAEVEPGKAFLLSDNRSMHLDSRDFGQVAPASCQRIAFRLWGTGGYGDGKHRFTLIW